MASSELKILIMGAGEVGKGLAQRLSAEGHEITVIDIRPQVLEELETHVDVMTTVGNGASAQVLLQAGIEKTDLFISVCDNDDRNLIACALAKQFNVPTTIARVRNEEYLHPDRAPYSQAMNIDLIINPDEVACMELFDLLDNPVASSVADFAGGRLKLVGASLTLDAPVCDRTLQELPELGFGGSLLIALIVRDTEVIIPRGDTRLLSGDRIFVIAETQSLNRVNEMGGVTNRNLRKVVMVGASRVSYFLATQYEKTDTHTILIEQDIDRCQEFASELRNATILQGDGTDINILTEAGIQDADGFIAASQDDETNILSALLAKERGAKRVITLLRKPQYIPLMARIKPIDVAVNPRLSTINAIMRYVRKGKILSMAILADGRAEAFEVEVAPDSVLGGRQLKEGFMPRNALLAAIVRNEEVIIPNGDDTLYPHDRAIVIALKEIVNRVDELFARSPKTSMMKKVFQSISKNLSGRENTQPETK